MDHRPFGKVSDATSHVSSRIRSRLPSFPANKTSTARDEGLCCGLIGTAILASSWVQLNGVEPAVSTW